MVKEKESFDPVKPIDIFLASKECCVQDVDVVCIVFISPSASMIGLMLSVTNI